MVNNWVPQRSAVTDLVLAYLAGGRQDCFLQHVLVHTPRQGARCTASTQNHAWRLLTYMDFACAPLRACLARSRCWRKPSWATTWLWRLCR
jgi:hypothetical protein